MPKRPPKQYEPLGNRSDWTRINGGKQFANRDTGELISRRQFENRKHGHSLHSHYNDLRSERAAKNPTLYPAKAPRQAATPSRISEGLRDFAKKRGATSEWYKAGKEPRMNPTEKQTRETLNREVDRQRKAAIDLKERAGVLTKRQAEDARVEARSERYWRNRMGEISDRLHLNKMPNGRDLTRGERIRLNKEYNQAHRKYEAARKPLTRWNILPPEGSDYDGGYYH